MSTGDAWVDAGRGLRYRDVITGTGAAEVAEGATVQAQYSALAAGSGKLLECTYQSGQALTFRVGDGLVPPGIDAGVLGMRQGGVRTLFLPSYLAYGRLGSPPSADLLVEIELERVQD